MPRSRAQRGRVHVQKANAHFRLNFKAAQQLKRDGSTSDMMTHLEKVPNRPADTHLEEVLKGYSFVEFIGLLR